MTKVILTQEILKELLHYDPDTGVFTWLYRDKKWFKKDRICNSWNSRFLGKTAGSLHPCNYLFISIIDRVYRAHRLAFLYMTGSMPPEEMDHINGIRYDNRWENIRPVNRLVNSKNTKIGCNNTSGVTGVSWSKKRRKWEANIQGNGKNVHLGMFVDIQEAALARKKAEAKYGYHENHGRPN